MGYQMNEVLRFNLNQEGSVEGSVGVEGVEGVVGVFWLVGASLV